MFRTQLHLRTLFCRFWLTLGLALSLGLAHTAQAKRMPDPFAEGISIDVPEGWRMLNSQNQGTSYLEDGQGGMVSWFKVPGGADPKRVYAVFDQIFKQYQKFKKLDEKEGVLSGSKGLFVVVGGINPRGVEVITKAIAAPFGQDAWVVLISGPVSRFQGMERTLDSIAGSFRVAAANQATQIAPPATPSSPATTASPMPLTSPTASSPTGLARVSTKDTVRLQPSFILDAYGHAQPIAASTMFIPYGWKTKGGVVWHPNYACTDYLNFEWSATSPDGRSTISVVPQMGWEQDNTGNARVRKIGCTKQPFTTIQSFMQKLVVTLWQGAKVEHFRRRPDLETQARVQSVPGNGQLRIRTEAADIFFSFTKDGVAMQGAVTTAVTFTNTSLPVAGMNNLEFLDGYALPGFAVTAPQGEYDFTLYERIRRSVQPNPQWVQLVAEHIAKLRKGELIEVKKRNDIWRETNDQIAAMRTDSWKQSQKSGDQRAAEFSQTIRGVENYQGAGGKTELTAGYANAWKLNDGTYVLSKDVGFDPRREFGVGAEKLEPVR